MAFSPGQSGNPKGRPVGIGTANRMRDLIHLQAEPIIKSIIAQALEGCQASQKLCVERIVPALRPVDHSNFEVSGTPEEQVRQVQEGLLKGAINPQQAAVWLRLNQHNMLTAAIKDGALTRADFAKWVQETVPLDPIVDAPQALTDFDGSQ